MIALQVFFGFLQVGGLVLVGALLFLVMAFVLSHLEQRDLTAAEAMAACVIGSVLTGLGVIIVYLS